MSGAWRGEFDCPVCGETVPAGAKSCPECGACEKSGWSEDQRYDALNLPDEDFDHDKFVEEEFGGPTRKTPSRRIWAIAAGLVVLAFLLPLMRGCAG
jgi:hypothetical protein